MISQQNLLLRIGIHCSPYNDNWCAWPSDPCSDVVSSRWVIQSVLLGKLSSSRAPVGCQGFFISFEGVTMLIKLQLLGMA